MVIKGNLITIPKLQYFVFILIIENDFLKLLKVALQL